MAKVHPLTLRLTDELQAFVDANSGDGTNFTNPSEFVEHLLWQRKLQDEAAQVRESIVAGYNDAIDGHVVPYEGDLRALMKRNPS
ncbi:hypothetical protein Plim_2490 [Planctopirus limnophila DSM 3776]|uniref:CopG family transcriptional regulator n=1 Tax=Planctopirus limnophila (strain ATCC 43296 / DSM 3776 / IFAM 1008 / Mu 290) TaxID=521674 RepID=D5SPU1_PLAL2|nr:hypothetical protein [Planctopirus limnophila]ADG68316.1 hypothetical protein Plim_2490 [Planctopirus limnophila DSM 3776]